MASVVPIVVRSCAQANCHDPIKHEHGMDLSTAGLIYENWVGKRGIDHCGNLPVYRVVAGDPEASYVMTKIRGPGPFCSLSNRMPPPPAEMLSACEIETIRAWIGAGAPPAPGGDADGGDMQDAAVDAPDDADNDAGDPDPSVCTTTKACDPIVEICVEVLPVTGSADCYTRWECFTHAFDDDTLEHACPAEIATFCGCDGTEYQAPWACPNRPYDHIGACGDGYSCDGNRARCGDPAPSCPNGESPAVVGGCWGPCVPIGMCRCDQNWQCPRGYRCLTLPEFHCGLFPPVPDAGTDGVAAPR